jgi:hypothetical protein
MMDHDCIFKCQCFIHGEALALSSGVTSPPNQPPDTLRCASAGEVIGWG